MDFIWFKPELYPECLQYLTRLPNDELKARLLTFGLEEWEGAPFPNVDGKQNGEGLCICRNFYGYTFFTPGKTKNGRLVIADLLTLEEIKPGLVGGNIRPEVFDNPKFKEEQAAHLKRDMARIAREAATVKAQDDEQARTRANAARRFLVTSAHFSGIRQPAQISSGELEDIYRAATLMQKEIPDVDAWMQATCPQAEAAPVPTDFHAYIAGARAAVVRRKEVTRGTVS